MVMYHSEVGGSGQSGAHLEHSTHCLKKVGFKFTNFADRSFDITRVTVQGNGLTVRHVDLDSASHRFELVQSWYPHSARLSLQWLNSSTLMPFALFAIFRSG